MMAFVLSKEESDDAVKLLTKSVAVLVLDNLRVHKEIETLKEKVKFLESGK